VTERLLDVAFLRTLLAAVVKKAKQPSDAGRAKLEAALAKLEKGRKEQVLSMAMGDLSPGAVQGSRRRSRLRELQAMLPAPPMPDADAKDYLECIVRAFAEFSMLPFADQREILRRTVREVVIDGRRSPSIPSTTLNGGFLAGFRSRHSGCGANSKLPSRPRC
jgi:hypothetical protein